MKTVCAWCHPAKPGDRARSHGICAYHNLMALQKVDLAQPEDYEAAWQELEPRAMSASITHEVVLLFFLAACVVALALALSSWAMAGFRIVG